MRLLICFTGYLLLYWPFRTVAQDVILIGGTVRDTIGNPVSQASVRLRDSVRSVPVVFSITKADGSFQFRIGPTGRREYILTVEHVQFGAYQQKLVIQSGETYVRPLPIVLSPSVKSMQEVVIRGDPPKFSIRGDTVEFRASAYRNGETRKVEDLLRNMQGFDVAADGRISFNGKEVDRILIEGEDLTEQQYQLLSRNLSAGLIEKVQVIQRYDPNRLSAGIAGSDKVGVNLKIDPNALKKWTGTWEFGLGSDVRRMTDLNLVRLAKSFKLIQFLQHNNTGLAANTDMHHYFEREGKPSVSADGPVYARGLIQTGQISPPSLGAAYSRSNNDFSGFTIGSWKAGDAVRIKILLGAADTRLMFLARGSQEVFPPDRNAWQLLSADTARSRDRQAVFRFNMSHDAGKRNLGMVTVDFLGGRADHQYGNLTTGAVRDRLGESLQTDGWLIRFTAEESFLLSPRKLLKVLVNGRKAENRQSFNVQTSRFAGYFGLDSSQQYFRQELPADMDMGEADVTMVARYKNIRWSAGIRAVGEQITYRSGTLLSSRWPKTDSLLQEGLGDVGTGRVTAYARVRMPQGRKGEWQLAGAYGFGSVQYADRTTTNTAAQTVYRLLARFSFAWTALKQFSFQVQSDRDLPATDFFHPDGLLSGHANILDGTRDLRFPVFHAATATFSLNDLQKGRSLVCIATGGLANNQYNTGQQWDPAYTILYPWLSDGNINASMQARGEQYLKTIRSKITFQLSQTFLRQDLEFNNTPGINRLTLSRIQAGWISAFRGFLNAEVSVAGWYTRNATIPEKGTKTVLSQWQYQGHAKMRARFSKNASAAFLYSGYLLLTDNYFQSLDLHLKWLFNRTWSITVQGHNLLGSRKIEQRQFSPNSRTVQSFQLVGRYLLARIQWQF